jgi:hypothetical protein
MVIDNAIALVIVEIPVSAGTNNPANAPAALNQYRIQVSGSGVLSSPPEIINVNGVQTRQYRFAVDLIAGGGRPAPP